jgi:hypothetical protein
MSEFLFWLAIVWGGSFLGFIALVLYEHGDDL